MTNFVFNVSKKNDHEFPYFFFFFLRDVELVEQSLIFKTGETLPMIDFTVPLRLRICGTGIVRMTQSNPCVSPSWEDTWSLFSLIVTSLTSLLNFTSASEDEVKNRYYQSLTLNWDAHEITTASSRGELPIRNSGWGNGVKLTSAFINTYKESTCPITPLPHSEFRIGSSPLLQVSMCHLSEKLNIPNWFLKSLDVCILKCIFVL